MQKLRSALFALCSLPLLAQTPAATSGDPLKKEANLASDEVRRVSGLVESGALPNVRLQEAIDKLDDARDDMVLRRTLYMPVESMTEEQSAEMLAAAQRRLDRQNARIAMMQELVDKGIAARNSLDPLKDELHFRQTTLDLAHSRADLLTEWQKHYDRPMPISANGQTAAHTALGFDHRGKVDVAITPDQPEGLWLREYLEAHNIPFFAFRAALPGKATGAHIHIGPASVRLARLLRPAE